MIGIDVLYLTKVSGDPNPFVSSGEFQINRADQKTTFFGDFSVALPVIGVATRPKDMKFLFVDPADRGWSGNRPNP